MRNLCLTTCCVLALASAALCRNVAIEADAIGGGKIAPKRRSRQSKEMKLNADDDDARHRQQSPSTTFVVVDDQQVTVKVSNDIGNYRDIEDDVVEDVSSTWGQLLEDWVVR